MNNFYKNVSEYISNKALDISNKIFNFFTKYPLLILILLIISIYLLIMQNNLIQASLYFGLFIIYSSLFLFFGKHLKQDSSIQINQTDIMFKLAGFFAVIFLGITYMSAAIGKYIIPISLRFGSIDTWIQFAGSILSGSLTIIALAFTLNEQEKRREEDKKNQLLPIVEFDILNKLDINQYNKTKFEIDKNWYLRIENASDNPLRNLKVVKCKVYLYNSREDYKDLKLQLPNINELLPNIIAKNKVTYVDIELNYLEILDIDMKFYEYLFIEINFEYYDVLLKNMHHHNLDVKLKNNQKDSRFRDSGYLSWTLQKLNNTFID